MSDPTGAEVRATFVEAWPELYIAHSPPFQTLELSSTEYGAVRRMHRAGPWSLFDCNIAKRIAAQLEDTLKVFSGACFMRLYMAPGHPASLRQ
jgi:hypothetical protein